MVWSAWVIIGFLCLIIELLTTSIVFLCLGVACFPVAIMAMLNVSTTLQLLLYGMFVLASIYWLKPVLKKLFYSCRTETKTNVAALIGQTGKVLTEIVPGSKQGRVLVGGDDWRAVSLDKYIIEVGALVIVDRVESNIVWVKKKEDVL